MYRDLYCLIKPPTPQPIQNLYIVFIQFSSYSFLDLRNIELLVCLFVCFPNLPIYCVSAWPEFNFQELKYFCLVYYIFLELWSVGLIISVEYMNYNEFTQYGVRAKKGEWWVMQLEKYEVLGISKVRLGVCTSPPRLCAATEKTETQLLHV